MKYIKQPAPNVTAVAATPPTSLPVKFTNMIPDITNSAIAPKRLFAASCGPKPLACAPLNRK